MARAPTTRKARSGRRRRRTAPVIMPPALEPKAPRVTPPLVRWQEVAHVAQALAETAAGAPDEIAGSLLGVLDDLVAPHLLLAKLHDLAAPVLGGNCHAEAELCLRMGELVRRLPGATALVGRVLEAASAKEGCGCEDEIEPHAADAGETESRTLDASALLDLAIAVARAFQRSGEAQRQDALSTVFGIAFAAQPLDRLSAALRARGAAGLAEEMTWIGGLRSTSMRAPPPMKAMSGVGPPMPGPPRGGLPRGPRHPGDGLGGSLLEHLKELIEGRKRWDPEKWDHPPLGMFDPPFVDTQKIRCEIALMMALKAHGESPPPRPARVVWSDNITAIEAPSPCAGNQATIRGRGFGSRKPAGTGIMVPINGVCTPLDVNPSAWTDTAVRFTLPVGVTSGPIGFVDLTYVKMYDAWVDRMNQATADAIAAAKCARVLAPDVKILPHFSECPPATGFNHLRAGSALIKSFTINLATLLVAEPSDALTLAWDVINAEQLRIERTSTQGPQFGASVALVNPPPISTFALGRAAHTGPERFTYRVTATGPCGGVTAAVVVIATKRPQLSIAQVEVTQGIQTIPASVRLVAQKPTVVRVTVRHGLKGWGANTVPQVTGRMKAQILGTSWSPWYDPVNGSTPPIGPMPGASITVPASPQRAKTNDTLNFLIPPAYCSGDVTILLDVRVTGFDARVPDFLGFSESIIGGVALVTFEKRRILNLRYIRVDWFGSGAPAYGVCKRTLLAAVPLLPTPMAIVAPLAGVGVQNAGPTLFFTTPDDIRDALLDRFYALHSCLPVATEFLGSDCPDDNDEVWVLIPGATQAQARMAGAPFRGSSRDIPSNVCFTPPNDGPYAAHELSHCLNQQHLSVMCPDGQQAAGGDAPGTWPNGGVLTDVPFDVQNNATVTGAILVWDVMTYCGSLNTWPSPRRWQQLWDYLGV
jgi:hypothetical protein